MTALVRWSCPCGRRRYLASGDSISRKAIASRDGPLDDGSSDGTREMMRKYARATGREAALFDANLPDQQRARQQCRHRHRRRATCRAGQRRYRLQRLSSGAHAQIRPRLCGAQAIAFAEDGAGLWYRRNSRVDAR